MKRLIIITAVCLLMAGCFMKNDSAIKLNEAQKKSMANFKSNADTIIHELVRMVRKAQRNEADYRFKITLNKYEKAAKDIKEYRKWEAEERIKLEAVYAKIDAQLNKALSDYSKSEKDYQDVMRFCDVMKSYLNRKMIDKNDVMDSAGTIIDLLKKRGK